MFDPYLNWLGLPPEFRPPTYYQLLDIDPNEKDVAIILAAVDRQTELIEPYRNGKHQAEWKKLFDEINEAFNTLIDPQRREMYDLIVPSASNPRTTHVPTIPQNASSEAEPWWKQNSLPDVIEEARKVEEKVSTSTPTGDWWTESIADEPISPPPQESITETKTNITSPPTINRTPLIASITPSVSPSGIKPKVDLPSERSGSSMIFIGIGLFIVTGIVLGGIVLLNKQKEQPTTKELVKKNEPIQEESMEPKKDNDSNEKSSIEAKKVTIVDKQSKLPGEKSVPKKKETPPSDVTRFRGHDGMVASLSIAPDGNTFASIGIDKQILLWTNDKSTRRHQMEREGIAIQFGMNPSLLYGVDGGSVVILEGPTNPPKAKFVNPRGRVDAFALAPSGTHLLTGATDGCIRWWNIAENKIEETITIATDKAITTLAISPDSTLAYVGLVDGRLAIVHLSEKKILQTIDGHEKGRVTGIAFSPDGKNVATIGEDKLGLIWQVNEIKPSAKLQGHQENPIAVSWLSDSSRVVTAGVDSLVMLWDAKTGKSTRWNVITADKPFSLAVDPQDRFVLVGEGKGLIERFLLPQVKSEDIPADVAMKPPTEKLAIPDKEAIQQATTALRTKYASDFERTLPADLFALMEKLLKRGSSGKEEPPMRYALFLEAGQLAIQTLNLEDGYKIIDAMNEWFAIDDLAEKVNLLDLMASKAPPEQKKNFVEFSLQMIALTEKESRLELADRALKLAEIAAGASGSKDLSDRVAATKKRLDGMLLEQSRLMAAQAKLKAMPDDPEANSLYGKHLCFNQNEWIRGLPMLVKCNDTVVKNIAMIDLANPKDLKGQVAVGNAWWDYAKSVPEMQKLGVYNRAKEWYDKALNNGIAGEEKLEISSRSRQVAKMLAPPPKETMAKDPSKPPAPNFAPVQRRNFETIKNAATIKSQWNVEGETTVETPGLRLKTKDGVLLTSRWRMLDNWKMVFTFIPDGRKISIEVFDELIQYDVPMSKNPSILTLERKGSKLTHSLIRGKNPTKEQTIQLGEKRNTPSTISFKVTGETRSEDGMLLTSVIVNGLVKPTE